MRRFLFSIFLFGGLSFALAALPVCAQVKESQRAKVSEVEINKQPLRDFVQIVRQLDEANRVDWTKPFSIEIEGVLTREGKLTQAKIVKTDGDKQLVEITQQGVLAIGDSGWLGYLRNQGVDKIKFVIAQTDANFSFTVIQEFPTPERAKTVASVLSGIVNAALLFDKNGTKKLGDDERTLLTSAKVTASEKTANINFVMPAGEFREMIRRRMNESQEKANG